jgi:hypothetical protein
MNNNSGLRKIHILPLKTSFNILVLRWRRGEPQSSDIITSLLIKKKNNNNSNIREQNKKSFKP